MAKPTVDSEQIRELAKLLEETGLTEVEVTEGDRSIRVSRGGTVGIATQAVPMAAPAVMPVAATGENDPGAVTSPMVGTIYLAQNPDSPPFVKTGSQVSEGDTLFIIEAMKVMNPILAPCAGTVTRILAEDAQPVEFGEILLVLE